MSVYSARALTTALVAKLDATALRVGTGTKPAGGGWAGTPGASVFNPYTVVYPTPGGSSDGSLGIPFDDVSPDFIISSFGASVEQAQWGDDLVRATLVSPAVIAVTGRTVMLAIPDMDAGVMRDDDVSPPLYHAPSRWRLMTTSST